MQAKNYAPTIEQRTQALKVAERFRPGPPLIRLALYLGLTAGLAWYNSNFKLPIDFDQKDLVGGLLVALVGEVVTFFSKKDRAKRHAEDDNELSSLQGPIQYRLTETGVDSWIAGSHEHEPWSEFRRFKLTDDLLILVLARGRDFYWVFPRAEIGEPLVSTVVRNLEQHGVVRLNDRDRHGIART